MSLLTISKPLHRSSSVPSKRIVILAATIRRDYSAWNSSSSSSRGDTTSQLKRGSPPSHRHYHQKAAPRVRHNPPSFLRNSAAAGRLSRHSSSMATKEQQQQQQPKQGRPRPEPRPSACIILLSPTNQVLLLHRVHTSSAFPSAHVFPGGNLSAFHDIDGDFPLPGDVARHEDSLTYR